MIIIDIFNELKRRNRVKTKAEFSIKFLRRAANYLCLCESGTRPVSDQTLAILARALSAHELHDLKGNVVAALLREDETPCQ